MLNPSQLCALVTVLRMGSLVKAAQALGETPSAVSQQLLALEESLDVVLFDHAAKGLTPTPTARLLADRARASLTALRLLEEDVYSICAGQLGTLRIASFPTASERLLPEALAHYASTHPSVDFAVTEGDAESVSDLLLDGLADVAITYRYDLAPRKTPDVDTVPLLSEDLLLLVPPGHPLTRRPQVSWMELREESWISTAKETSGAQVLERLCAAAGFAPDVTVRSNDFDVIRRFVNIGLGIALVPALSARNASGVKVVHLQATGVRRHISLLHRGERLNPLINDFLTSMRHTVELLSGPGVQSAVGGTESTDAVLGVAG